MGAQAGWYLIYVTAGSEAKARDALRKEGIHAWMPEFTAFIRHSGESGFVTRPLFPRYLFAVLDPSAGEFAKVKKDGWAQLVRFGETPNRLPDSVVDALAVAHARGAFNQLPPAKLSAADYPQGMNIRVIDGPYAEIIGKIKKQTHGKRAEVLLEWMGREIKANISLDRLAPA